MGKPRVDWELLQGALSEMEPYSLTGRVQEMVGLVISSRGPQSAVGGVCKVQMPPPHSPILAEVVGFRRREVLLMPYGEVRGIRPQARVVLTDRQAEVPVGDGLLGRGIAGMGHTRGAPGGGKPP